MTILKPGKYKVTDLEKMGVLLVQDGNHGEYRPRSEEFSTTGTAFIRAADMDDGAVKFDTAEKIADVALKRITKGIGKPGDILLSHKGTVGKLAKVPMTAPPFVCSPQTTFWRTLSSDVVDGDYLYYFMSSSLFHNQLNARKGETDMAPYVSLTAQRDLDLILPSIAEQRKISDILSPIDNKIRINNQINKTLEEFAKTIFKEWFVDFGPVKAKVGGKTNFDNEVSGLFPDSFESNSFGAIPKGWKISNMDAATNLIIDHRGKTPLKLGAEWTTSGHQAISAKNIKANRLTNLENRYIDSALYSKWMKNPLVAGDILMTSEAPLGELYFITDRTDFVLSQRVYGIRANKEFFTSEFLYFWLDSANARSDMESRATGTTVTGIRQSELRKVQVLQPSLNLQKRFSAIVGPILLTVAHNELEIRELTNLRELLLPKLICGEREPKEILSLESSPERPI